LCGIFGCVLSSGAAAPLIYEGLKRLEYRGYDSVGVATISEGRIQVKKEAGKIVEVNERLNLLDLPGSVGIGHTRWATHGAPSMVNAHPHTDCSGEVAVVHNGIIENFAELRKELESRGHVFRSRTDTEVISHLIEEFLTEKMTFEESVRRALRTVRGSYAIACLHASEPGKIVCARRESPLVLGLGKDATYCASDIPAFLPLTTRVMHLEEDELAVLDAAGASISTVSTGEARVRLPLTVTWTAEMAEKGGYQHFMLKEIHEQPISMRNVLRTQQLYFDLIASTLEAAKKVYLVACGTSYHACVAASYLFSKLCHLHTQPVVASEFIENYGESVDPDTAVLAVSQSGETADTLNAVRYAREKGAVVVGITNVMGSSITRLSSIYVGQNSGPEIGVAATKTFTAQLMVFTKLALTLGRKRGVLPPKEADWIEAKLSEIPDAVRGALENCGEKAREIAEKYRDTVSFCYLGRGINSATALEGRLKLLEIAYSPSLAYPAGESKHGFIALVDKGYPVIFIAPNDGTRSKIVGNIMEMRARQANIITITDGEDEETECLADECLKVGSGIPDLLTPMVYVVPLQLFAYYMSVVRGYNPDQPRNLAKSVTVE